MDDGRLALVGGDVRARGAELLGDVVERRARVLLRVGVLPGAAGALLHDRGHARECEQDQADQRDADGDFNQCKAPGSVVSFHGYCLEVL
jgi:hypothetical protein